MVSWLFLILIFLLLKSKRCWTSDEGQVPFPGWATTSLGGASSHHSLLLSSKGLTVQADAMQAPSATNSNQYACPSLRSRLAVQMGPQAVTQSSKQESRDSGNQSLTEQPNPSCPRLHPSVARSEKPWIRKRGHPLPHLIPPVFIFYLHR